jgi:hypothetical protein
MVREAQREFEPEDRKTLDGIEGLQVDESPAALEGHGFIRATRTAISRRL